MFHVEHFLLFCCSTWNTIVESVEGLIRNLIHFNSMIQDLFCTKIRHCHSTPLRTILKISLGSLQSKWDAL